VTEEQIAAELAAKLEEPAVAEAPVDIQPEEPQNFVDKLLPEEQLTRSQLYDWFEVPMHERHQPDVERYINDIYAWARDNAGSGEFHELLRVINEQEQIMGSRNKPGRVARLYKYIKISQLRQKLAAQERVLYG
jgi:hypothetical protein